MKNSIFFTSVFLIASCGGGDPENDTTGVQLNYDSVLNSVDSAGLNKLMPLADSINGKPNEMVLQKENGLRVEWERKNQGVTITASDVVMINYSARVSGGDPYDSNEKIGKPVPVKVGLGLMVPGMEEGLQAMHAGDKGRIMIPSKLGYGADGLDKFVPPNSSLIVVIEIVEVLEPIVLEKGVRVYKWQESDSGKTAMKNQWITFDYFAYCQGSEGKMYDNSFQNGEPYKMKFQNDNLMEGLHIGMSVLKPGENAMVHIPAKLAYGSKGLHDLVPANTDVMYDIRVISIK